MISKPQIGSQLDWQHPITRGCVFRGLMNELVGSKLINLANTNDGIISGAPWVGSQFGGGIFFNNTLNAKVNLGKPNSLNLQGEMTISLWANFTTTGATYRYLASDYNAAGSNAQFALQHNNTNKMTFFWANGGTQAPTPGSAEGTTTILAGRWYHLVGIRRGSAGAWASEIYVNGKRDKVTFATTATNPGTQVNAGNSMLGQTGDYTGANLTMAGVEDNVTIWNRALSAEEISQLYSEPFLDII